MAVRIALIIVFAFSFSTDCWGQPHRDKKVRADLAKMTTDENWYYDDLEAGLDAAAKPEKTKMDVVEQEGNKSTLNTKWIYEYRTPANGSTRFSCQPTCAKR